MQWRQVQLRMSGGVLGALGSWFGYGGQPDHDASEVRSILALTSGATSAYTGSPFYLIVVLLYDNI